jgi:myo-inositol 2-dehydrogenase/D-chiro-inositol 1-dehydrogenase
MYAEFLTTQVTGVNLIAVADIIPERAKKCAETFGIAKAYFSHQEINDDKDVAAVIVVATTGNHKEIVVDAAAKGKSIFCEKPMALTLDHAREMLQADRLIIVAAAGEMPEQLYASVGFIAAGLQRGVQRMGAPERASR